MRRSSVFVTSGQYDQLVQLLILVRAPKLSKDFRPSEVKKILNQSLQVLTDDDLSAMVSTMEQMDNLEDTLQGYRAALQNARIISREYTRYNQYMLGKKGQAYLNAQDKAQSLRNQLQDEQGPQECAGAAAGGAEAAAAAIPRTFGTGQDTAPFHGGRMTCPPNRSGFSKA